MCEKEVGGGEVQEVRGGGEGRRQIANELMGAVTTGFFLAQCRFSWDPKASRLLLAHGSGGRGALMPGIQ